MIRSRQYPDLAISLEEGGLCLVKSHGSVDKKPTIIVKEFDDELFTPDFINRSVNDRNKLLGVIKEALNELPSSRNKRISLVLPDIVSRVFMLEFDEVPGKQDELEHLIRFKLKKIIPFDMDSAVFSYNWFKEGDRFIFIVAVMHKPVIHQLEEIFHELDLHCGLIDTKTNNLLNLYTGIKTSYSRISLVVSVFKEYMSILLLKDDTIVLYRGKSIAVRNKKAIVNREILQSVLYWYDRLKGDDLPEIYVIDNQPGLKLEDIKSEYGLLRVHEEVLKRLINKFGVEDYVSDSFSQTSVLAAISASLRSYLK